MKVEENGGECMQAGKPFEKALPNKSAERDYEH